MDLSDEQQRATLRDHLGGLLSSRSVICGIAPLAAFVDWVALLEQAGARRPLLLANGLGAGPCPTAGQAEVALVEVPESATMTDELRLQDGIVRRLPDDVVRAIEAYDPGAEALWLVGPFIGTDPILGREVIGGRPKAWVALEDKLVVDQIWDAVGAPRSDTRVVPVALDDLREAGDAVDLGHGAVWTGDARDGFHGGGDFVRWVVTDDDAAAAHAFFVPRCDRVRVMPFLEGVPCSVHGIVLPDGTAAFRPVELAIMRGPRRRFVFGGQGTTWDPPDADRAQMRDLVRRTGELLRERVGYRGCFGIDGVLTADGFRPTELNPRMSGGIASMARQVDAGLFNLLQFNLLAGRDPKVDVAELEAWALPAMDASPLFKAIAVSSQRVASEPFDLRVEWDGETLTRSWDDTGWSVSVGPTPAGTFCKLNPPDDLPGTPRVAELNVALVRFLDAELGTAIGEVTAAPDVRR